MAVPPDPRREGQTDIRASYRSVGRTAVNQTPGTPPGRCRTAARAWPIILRRTGIFNFEEEQFHETESEPTLFTRPFEGRCPDYIARTICPFAVRRGMLRPPDRDAVENLPREGGYRCRNKRAPRTWNRS